MIALPGNCATRVEHLADCRACALSQPMPHDYASLIDEPIVADEFRVLAANLAAPADARAYAAAIHTDAECPSPTCTEDHAPARAERAPANDRDCADDVACPCGNDVMGEGFWPAGPASLVAPDKDGPWDGRTIACLDCGRLIDTAPELAEPNADEWRPWTFPVVGRLAQVVLAAPLPD